MSSSARSTAAAAAPARRRPEPRFRRTVQPQRRRGRPEGHEPAVSSATGTTWAVGNALPNIDPGGWSVLPGDDGRRLARPADPTGAMTIHGLPPWLHGAGKVALASIATRDRQQRRAARHIVDLVGYGTATVLERRRRRRRPSISTAICAGRQRLHDTDDNSDGLRRRAATGHATWQRRVNRLHARRPGGAADRDRCPASLQAEQGVGISAILTASDERQHRQQRRHRIRCGGRHQPERFRGSHRRRRQRQRDPGRSTPASPPAAIRSRSPSATTTARAPAAPSPCASPAS